jgi:hypothetical protein
MKLLTVLIICFVMVACGLRDGDFVLQPTQGRYETSVMFFELDSFTTYFALDTTVDLFIAGISLLNDCALDAIEITSYAGNDSTGILRVRVYQEDNGLIQCAASGLKDTVIQKDASFFNSRRRWILQKKSQVDQWVATDTAWFLQGKNVVFTDTLRSTESWNSEKSSFWVRHQFNKERIEGSYHLFCAEDTLQECEVSDSSVVNKSHPDFIDPDTSITVYRHQCDLCAVPLVWSDTVANLQIMQDSAQTQWDFQVRYFTGCQYMQRNPFVYHLESNFAVVHWKIFDETSLECVEEDGYQKVLRMNDQKIFSHPDEWQRLGIYTP